jgi:hypothetical protein
MLYGRKAVDLLVFGLNFPQKRVSEIIRLALGFTQLEKRVDAEIVEQAQLFVYQRCCHLVSPVELGPRHRLHADPSDQHHGPAQNYTGGDDLDQRKTFRFSSRGSHDSISKSVLVTFTFSVVPKYSLARPVAALMLTV